MCAPESDWRAALTEGKSFIFAEDREAIMNKVRNKEYKALLKKVSEIFDEADNVFGIFGEEALAERSYQMRRNTSWRQSTTRKRSMTRRYGIDLGLRWSFRGWRKNGTKNATSLVPPRSRNPEQYLTKEQQKACLDWPLLS